MGNGRRILRRPVSDWMKMLWPGLLLCSCALGQAFAEDFQRQQLPAKQLLTPFAAPSPVDMAAFAPPVNVAQSNRATHRIEGRLQLVLRSSAPGFTVLKDDFNYATDPAERVWELPPFDFAFIQVGDQLVPLQRGAIPSDHPHWEWVLEPGRVWQEAGDGDYSRAALPFSLQQRGENCIHNGVLSFLYKSDGSVSRVAYQIGSETCFYFQFDLWGEVAAIYTPGRVPGAAAVAVEHQQHIARRLPVRPIEALTRDYPAVDQASFNGSPHIDPGAMTAYGLVIDGVHYAGGCQTRFGGYPFCEVLDVPSYSLAKSLVGGLGLMRMQKLYPGVANARVVDYVPECAASGQWGETTFSNTLDMATGLYQSAVYDEDEAAPDKVAKFFSEDSHAAKIGFACEYYPRRAPVGTRWVYHSSDTYVLGAGLNGYLQRYGGAGEDIFEDVLRPLWLNLNLSPTSQVSRRTYDTRSQPFVAYGLTLHTDDIARLATFINGEAIRSELDTGMLDAALQRNPEDRGLKAADGAFYYKNGFWAYPDFTPAGCEQPVVLPFMVGYGGINVVLLPNQTIYYYFSDGGKFSWLKAATELSRLKSFCPIPQEPAND